ncbi:22157_t:CDS:1 [Dentiscutata erythropus]|uniref:22157_t:CDS:1 n=1 Tax=Dentiscutata erythropus TaxID=1348616 RepID=A0A9N9FS63_9GLOM|nr:22157_t:CDS:1 [Dentiscutata erythropus]
MEFKKSKPSHPKVGLEKEKQFSNRFFRNRWSVKIRYTKNTIQQLQQLQQLHVVSFQNIYEQAWIQLISAEIEPPRVVRYLKRAFMFLNYIKDHTARTQVNNEQELHERT